MDVVTLGETLVCLIAREDGRLGTVKTFERAIGGAESNTAIGLARLGVSTGWLSQVSRDDFGDHILELLRDEQVDLAAVKRSERPTGLMLKARRGPGDVEVHYYRHASAAAVLDADDIDQTYLATARRLHITGVTLALGAGPRRAVSRAIEIARASGMPISFDPNLRPKLWPADEAAAAFRSILSDVTDFLGNEQEARLITGRDDIEGAARHLQAQGIRSVVIKRGSSGVYGLRGDEAVQLQAREVEVVDPVGAGDAFNAGYLFGELNGESFGRSLEIGNWTASHVVAEVGDYEGFPPLEALVDWQQERPGKGVVHAL